MLLDRSEILELTPRRLSSDFVITHGFGQVRINLRARWLLRVIDNCVWEQTLSLCSHVCTAFERVCSIELTANLLRWRGLRMHRFA